MTSKFSIYELFLIGIAFDVDAEANAFVDMLNKELNNRMNKLVENNIEIDCIFKYGRELSENERAEWLAQHSEDVADWTLAQKYELKVQLYQWREYIPGIVQNQLMNNMASNISDVISFGYHKLKRIGLVTVGELEAADLSKIDALTPENIDVIQKDLLWWRERRCRDEHPDYYERRKNELLAEHNSVKHQEIEPCPVEEKIDNLDLSIRPYNILKRAGVNTLDDLKKMTQLDLKNIRNMNEKTFEEICEKAKAAGLVFADE